MADDLTKVAEKKLKSRIRKFKKVNKSEEEKQKFFEQLGASVEIFLPSKKPEEQSDSIIFYTDAEGKIVDSEFSYTEGDEVFESLPISEKDLKVLIESFKDFHLEYEDID